jgi:tRNA uridine 5-carboxymethylaminomethyl modification enzyme
MFTSRAEYRLILREDNAADRLLPIGRRLGRIDDDRWRRFEAFGVALAEARARLERTAVPPSAPVNDRLAAAGSTPLSDRRATLADLLRRPELGWADLAAIAAAGERTLPDVDPRVAERLEIEMQYAGYLERQETEARRLVRFEELRLPDDLDYGSIRGLSREVAEVLAASRPRSLGQAARTSGVTPVAVSILLAHLDIERRRGAIGPG